MQLDVLAPLRERRALQLFRLAALDPCLGGIGQRDLAADRRVRAELQASLDLAPPGDRIALLFERLEMLLTSLSRYATTQASRCSPVAFSHFRFRTDAILDCPMSRVADTGDYVTIMSACPLYLSLVPLA